MSYTGHCISLNMERHNGHAGLCLPGTAVGPAAQDPARRPDARSLQQHTWLAASRTTLRASWSDTLKGRRPTAAMEPVSAVVDATLRADAEGTAAGAPPPPGPVLR